MTLTELERQLEEIHVPREWYSLGKSELKPGGDGLEYCEERGKWVTFQMEHGEKRICSEFPSEEEGCHYFYDLMVNLMKFYET